MTKAITVVTIMAVDFDGSSVETLSQVVDQDSDETVETVEKALRGELMESCEGWSLAAITVTYTTVHLPAPVEVLSERVVQAGTPDISVQ